MKDKIRILSKKRVYKGHFALDQFELQFMTYHRGWSDTIRREVFDQGDAVAVLLYDPDTRNVVLIEQFRVGALNDTKSPWLLELVAGVIDDHEIPIDVARREVKEETGLDVNELLPITSYWSSPGGSAEFIHLFCGRVDANKASGFHGLVSEHEDIKVVVMSIDHAFDKVVTGEIRNAITIIGLQWLKLHKGDVFPK